jgi:GDP-L-fucose synthase
LKIIILGGHGFVGRNLFEQLQAAGYNLLSLSRRDGLDLTEMETTLKFFKELNPDIILNCSAEVGSLNFVTRNAGDVFDANMRMILNLYRGVKEAVPNAVIINPVANCSYPGKLDFYTEDKFWEGAVHESVLSFGNTRRMITVVSTCYKIQYNIRSINYFVPNMYGPYDYTDPDKAHALNALIAKTVKAKIEKKNELEVWGTGKVIREWLYAKDFASVVLNTLRNIDSEKFMQPFNIGQNLGLSIKELVEIIVNETGFNGNIKWNTSMPDGAPKKVMDDKMFRSVFPNFEFTTFKEGIQETVKYYESVYPY